MRAAGDEHEITIVSGLPRSGTSLMMQMLAAAGMPLLVDETRPADESNPRGYFEYEPVRRLKTDASWLPLARGRAVKIIHWLLPALPLSAQFRYRIVFMHRSMEEVLASQQKMLGRSGRPGGGLPPEKLAGIFAAQKAEALRWIHKASNQAQLLEIDYSALIAHPLEAARKVRDFIGQGEPAALAAVVEASLYRERNPKNS